ncbi:hypothetical protein C1646_760295 [Rhizophagus diaphanus]|nr:hypothetical protein C1646_760295 [Rhizophagus diaphanus] [Rhizophagus sp. MUCL 43196]
MDQPQREYCSDPECLPQSFLWSFLKIHLQAQRLPPHIGTKSDERIVLPSMLKAKPDNQTAFLLALVTASRPSDLKKLPHTPAAAATDTIANWIKSASPNSSSKNSPDNVACFLCHKSMESWVLRYLRLYFDENNGGNYNYDDDGGDGDNNNEEEEEEEDLEIGIGTARDLL